MHFAFMLFALQVTAVPHSQVTVVPHSLEMMRASRARIDTARFRWTLHSGGATSEFDFQRGALGDWIHSPVVGPEDAAESRALNDNYKPKFAYFLDDDGNVYENVRGTIFLREFEADGIWAAQQVLDPFTLGCDYRLVTRPNAKKMQDFISRYEPERKLSSGLIEATAVLSDGDRLTWTINPTKGWLPESIRLFQADGTNTTSVEFELACTEGVWFPTTAKSKDKDGVVTASVEVSGMQFNRSEHPADLTLIEFGVEPGFLLARGEQLEVWDGQRFLSSNEEWNSLLKSGFVREGPAVRRAVEDGARSREIKRIKRLPEEFTAIPDAWEQYVRKFCFVYALEEAQIKQASEILERCTALAAKVLLRDPDLGTTLRKLKSQMGSDEWQKEVRSIASSYGERLNPLRKIFDEELKPRLFLLPSKHQIEKAGDPEKIRDARNRP